ncbi:MAG: DUF3185 family protein [Opitutaceae bacterium]|nr:DUF3185 family protein [Opitutaceae bacterium]
MNRLLSIVFLVVGIMLIIYGASASDSVSSEFSRLFTGAPTDRTLWLLIGGAAATAIGVSGLLFGSKAR